MRINPLPPVDYLRECFDYNPDTGELTWRDRPDSHFLTASKAKRHRTLRAGKPAGTTTNAYGYRVVQVTYGETHKVYQVHRICYALMSGDTRNPVDHINGERTDNRADNLRSASSATNAANRQRYTRPSRLPGAYYDKSRGKWLAQIKRNYKAIHLGRFDTEQEAHAAYLAAKEQPPCYT